MNRLEVFPPFAGPNGKAPPAPRVLTEYESSLIRPAVQEFLAAQGRLNRETALLAGESHRGWDLQVSGGVLSLVPPAPPEP